MTRINTNTTTAIANDTTTNTEREKELARWADLWDEAANDCLFHSPVWETVEALEDAICSRFGGRFDGNQYLTRTGESKYLEQYLDFDEEEYEEGLRKEEILNAIAAEYE